MLHRLLFGQLNFIPVMVLMSSLGSSCQSQWQSSPARFISDKTHQKTFQTLWSTQDSFEHPYVGDRDQSVCHYMDLNHTPYFKFILWTKRIENKNCVRIENNNCVRHSNSSMQSMNTKLNFIKSVNKLIKELQGSNGPKAEDSAVSASILGLVSASPEKEALFYSWKKERAWCLPASVRQHEEKHDVVCEVPRNTVC